MLISDIKPFVRYARVLTLTGGKNYPVRIPYDARLFYIKEGRAAIRVSDQVFKMAKGSALLIAPGIEYSIKIARGSATVLAFNFDCTDAHRHLTFPIVPASPESFDPSLLLKTDDFEDEEALSRWLFVSDARMIERVCERIITEYRKKLICHGIITGSLMAEAIAELVRASKTLRLNDESVSSAVLAYIQKNYASPLTNKAVAEHFGFHPNYLSALVRSAVGMPMHKYVLHLRLTRAAELLESGEYSVSRVAELTGFCDIYYFTRYFTASMKMTPSEFMKGDRE